MMFMMFMMIIVMFLTQKRTFTEVMARLNEKEDEYGIDINTLKDDKVKYYIRTLQNGGKKSVKLFNLADFDNFHLSHGEIPENVHQTFSGACDTDVNAEPQWYYLMLTTRNLIQNHSHGGPLHIDGTYKTNYMGIPVINAGTTDSCRKWHPTTLILSSGETSEHYAAAMRAIKTCYK